jgi:large subunit ribosomal protein L2
MTLKTFKPLTPGLRHRTSLSWSLLTKKRPEKKLTVSFKKQAGRNSSGKVTVRHQGGGEKRLYRMIDFVQDKKDIEARVVALEYDPSRTTNIALLLYPDGEKRYILAPEGLKVGDKVTVGQQAELKTGNRLPLSAIPAGMPIHNIELEPGKGGKIVKSAGTSALIQSKEENFAIVKLPSGEIRKVSLACYASLGQLSNPEWRTVILGKAGRKRHMGIRPSVRGVAMHPAAHPHGGGEGRSGIGMPGPKSPWGKKVGGIKTRKRNKASNKLIVKRRK